MRKNQKANRHKSNEIGNYIARHQADRAIYVNNHGKIFNLFATSGRVTINGTPGQNESTQQLNVKVDKQNASASIPAVPARPCFLRFPEGKLCRSVPAP